MLLISPTEHELQSLLKGREDKWRVSSLPESHGCDIFSLTKAGVIGFQRKTIPDLLASLQDGRLYKELSQLSVSATVIYSFLIVESAFTTTTDGQYYTQANLSTSTFRSIIAKFHLFGVGFFPSSDPSDTLYTVTTVSRYLSSGRAQTIQRPKQVTNTWGQITNEEYGVFLLQSFPGIGPKVARSIYQHFGGVPIAWSVTADELARVPGIGRVRAERLLAALGDAAGSPGP
jgi:ERCC4-type nuclease